MFISSMMQPAESSQDEDSEDTSAASAGAGASGGVADVFSGVSIRVSTMYIFKESTYVYCARPYLLSLLTL